MVGIRDGAGIGVGSGIGLNGNVRRTTFRCFLLLALTRSAGDGSITVVRLVMSFLFELEKGK